MFDFYGTVVDMQGGLIEAITPYLESKNYTAQPAGRVVTWWRSTTPWTRSVRWYRRSSAWPRSLKLVILSNGDPDMLETGVSSPAPRTSGRAWCRSPRRARSSRTSTPTPPGPRQ